MRKPRSADETLLWLLIVIAFELGIITFVILMTLLIPAPVQLV